MNDCALERRKNWKECCTKSENGLGSHFKYQTSCAIFVFSVLPETVFSKGIMLFLTNDITEILQKVSDFSEV